MKTGKLPYLGIDQTMKGIKIQTLESVPVAVEYFPRFRNPEQLFYWFKRRTKYTSDPRGGELLQSLPTLFFENYWGRPGAGDCDCFTIAIVAAMLAQGWKNIRIYLVGRTTDRPAHIYAGIKWRGKERILDLTNNKYNFERRYPYKQKLIVN